MISQLRQTLRALDNKLSRIEDGPPVVSLGVAEIDHTLAGGLARGALHEIAAAGEAHTTVAAGFTLGISSLSLRTLGKGGSSAVWIATDMAIAESGMPYGPGLDTFGLAPERLVTVAAAHTRDVLWAMEEALRCRTAAAVIGELRHEEIDSVAVRRLSLAVGQSGTLALLLRASPPHDASTAVTRWIVGAAPNDSFAVRLMRNRRGPLGKWILQWSESNERFVIATHAQSLAAPAVDRPHRQVA